MYWDACWYNRRNLHQEQLLLFYASQDPRVPEEPTSQNNLQLLIKGHLDSHPRMFHKFLRQQIHNNSAIPPSSVPNRRAQVPGKRGADPQIDLQRQSRGLLPRRRTGRRYGQVPQLIFHIEWHNISTVLSSCLMCGQSPGFLIAFCINRKVLAHDPEGFCIEEVD